MLSKSNLAYREKHIKTNQNSHIGRIKKKKIKKEIKAAVYIFFIILASIVLSFYIINLVKNNELSMKINKMKDNYKIQQSESVRLRSILETTCLNTSEIEKYATTKLGMRKNNNRKINYISSYKGNPIKLRKNMTQTFKRDENLFSRIKNWLLNILGISD